MSSAPTTQLMRLGAALGLSEDVRAGAAFAFDGRQVACVACQGLVPVERFAADGPSCPNCHAALDRPGTIYLPPQIPTEKLRVPLTAPALPDDLPFPSPETHTPMIDTGDEDPPAAIDLHAAAPKVGKHFGRYLIEEEISRGGMGVVYRAHDPQLNRTVALKLLLAGGHASREQVVRFRREATSVARLHHPNIVPIHEVGELEGLHYLTMEYIRGIPVDKLLTERKRIPPIDACRIVRDVAYALHYAHHQGIVHRDIKPGNIILAFEEALTEAAVLREGEGGRARRFLPPYRAMLMDFGLAKELDQVTTLTETGVAMGTPHYMSPEQARGDDEKLDGRSDLYSLGVVLYEMLTGEKPLQAAAVVDLMLLVVSQEPVPPRQRNPTLSAAVETICLRAMAKDRRQRYQTALQLVQDVESYLAGEEIAARPLGSLYYAGGWIRRHLGAAVSALVSGLFVLGMALHVAWVRPWLAERQARETTEALRAEAARRDAAAAERAAKLLEEVQALAALGKAEQVASALQMRLEDWSGTPAAAGLYVHQAEAMLAQGLRSSALDAFAECLVRTREAGWTARAWKGVARALVEEGRSADVLTLVYARLAVDPAARTDAELLAYLGRAHLGAFDPPSAAVVFAAARRCAEGTPPRGVEEGEEWCRLLGAGAVFRAAVRPVCAAALSSPPRLFVGGYGGVAAVDGSDAPDADCDPSTPTGARELAVRALRVEFSGPVIALAAAPAAAGRPDLLLALEWRGPGVEPVIHALALEGLEARALQRFPTLALPGPEGAILRAADLDGDGEPELVLAGPGVLHPFQMWKMRAGVFLPWSPAFAPDRVDLPVLGLDVVRMDGAFPGLAESVGYGPRARLLVWQYTPRRRGFELRQDEVRDGPARLIGGPLREDRLDGVLTATPDRSDARGPRAAEASSRAGVEYVRAHDGKAESVLRLRVPTLDSHAYGLPQAVLCRRVKSPPLVVVRCAAEHGARQRLWFARAEAGARPAPLELLVPDSDRPALLAAVDLDGDGNDEAVFNLGARVYVVGPSPWPPRRGPAASPAAWLAAPVAEGKGPAPIDPRPHGDPQRKLDLAAELARVHLDRQATRVLQSAGAEAGSELRIALGRSLEAEGDPRGALAVYNRVLQGEAAVGPEVLLGRARCLAWIGEARTAAGELRDLLVRTPPGSALRGEIARRLADAESTVHRTVVAEDRFESVDGEVRLSTPFPYGWDRKDFLLHLRSSVPEEHCAAFAGDFTAGAWRLEGEWREESAHAGDGYGFGVWQGPAPDAPVRGFRVRLVEEPGPVVPQEFLVLEGGPGFGVWRAWPITLPQSEWLRFDLGYHPADGRLQVQVVSRAGVEVGAFELPDCGAPLAGPTYAGLWVGRTEGGPAQGGRLELSSLRWSADPAAWRAAECAPGDRAHRLMASGEATRACEEFAAGARAGRLSDEAAFARIVALWSRDREEATRVLREQVALRPIALAERAEPLLWTPQDPLLAFLLGAWPDDDAGPPDASTLAAADEFLRGGRRFEAMVRYERAAAIPGLEAAAACGRAWTRLEVGSHSRAANELSDLLLSSLQTPLDPVVVDRIARGLLALAAFYPEGSIENFLRHHELHRNLRVRTVRPGGEGERAGLRAGDVFLESGDRRIESADDLVEATSVPPGRVRVRRGKEIVSIDLPARGLDADLAEEYAVGEK